MPRLLVFLVALMLWMGASVHAQESPPVKDLILPGESFLVEKRPAFILWPAEDKRQKPQPWVCYSPTLPGLPDQHEKWMHEKFLAAGIAVAGIDVGEGHGSPEARALFSKLYEELTERRGFAKRMVLLGRSRGGLWNAAWAVENTDKVAGFAGIYPVFDLRSYPKLEGAAPAYRLTAEQLAQQLDQHNPIAKVSRLAKAKIPVYLIHGDQDVVVPLEANSGAFQKIYAAAGVPELVTLNVAPGQGHNYWEGFFRCQPLIDFAIERARAGAK
jgi:alpha-beta hydrolase superfamily lysophospholipase